MEPITEEQINSLVDNSADILIEALKLAPGDAAATTEKVLAQLQAKLEGADFTGAPSPVKILHSAVNIGQVIASQTESDKDDVLLEKADLFLDKYEENGEKLVAAFFSSLFKKIAPKS